MYDNYFVLRNGNAIPVIGFGTGIAKGISSQPMVIVKRFIKESIKNILDPDFKKNNKYTLAMDLKKDRSLKSISCIAVDAGCQLIDTARAYVYSESYIGQSLFGKDSKFKREDIFIITKATNYAQRNGTILEEFELSLNNLKTDYVDLFLLHWPQTGTYIDSWKVLEEIYESGRAKAIGICNCHVHHLEELKKYAKIMPMVNELECHPLLQQWEVREYCKKEGIQIIAHTPTGKMAKQIVESKEMQKIAAKYGVSISQVILRWHYQLGDISIPNTTSEKHLKENLDIFRFSLTDEEMDEIRKLDCNYRVWPNPDNCDFTRL